MPSEFANHYILWVFFSTLGAFQFVAAKNTLRGAMFLGRFPRLTMVLGLGLVLLATVVYFASESRNQPDSGLGLDANEQGRWFAISAAAAIGLSLGFASLVNLRWGVHHGWDDTTGDAPPTGIQWLQHTTFAQALVARLRFYRRWRRVAGSD